MLEANPSLNLRDVQHILVRTAVKNDPFDDGWSYNAAGYHVNHKFGFGRVDAATAVILIELENDPKWKSRISRGQGCIRTGFLIILVTPSTHLIL